jgi:hypothetical protein
MDKQLDKTLKDFIDPTNNIIPASNSNLTPSIYHEITRKQLQILYDCRASGLGCELPRLSSVTVGKTSHEDVMAEELSSQDTKLGLLVKNYTPLLDLNQVVEFKYRLRLEEEMEVDFWKQAEKTRRAEEREKKAIEKRKR